MLHGFLILLQSWKIKALWTVGVYLHQWTCAPRMYLLGTSIFASRLVFCTHHLGAPLVSRWRFLLPRWNQSGKCSLWIFDSRTVTGPCWYNLGVQCKTKGVQRVGLSYASDCPCSLLLTHCLLCLSQLCLSKTGLFQRKSAARIPGIKANLS